MNAFDWVVVGLLGIWLIGWVLWKLITRNGQNPFQ